LDRSAFPWPNAICIAILLRRCYQKDGQWIFMFVSASAVSGRLDSDCPYWRQRQRNSENLGVRICETALCSLRVASVQPSHASFRWFNVGPGTYSIGPLTFQSDRTCKTHAARSAMRVERRCEERRRRIQCDAKLHGNDFVIRVFWLVYPQTCPESSQIALIGVSYVSPYALKV
jgi:hypothetical protein